jgi:hypothetical protein
MGLQFTIATGTRQRSHSRVWVPRDSRPRLTASDSRLTQPQGLRSPYLYPPRTGWFMYNPRHWVPFSSPPTTRRVTVEVFGPASTRETALGQSESQSHIATDGQPVSKSWCRAPYGAHDQILITVWQLRSCFCVVPSMTRGRVCHSYMLLTLARAVVLRSESLGTRDHILLSQICDFPFRRLLRLAQSRWRYSTPPPHGFLSHCLRLPGVFHIYPRSGPNRKHPVSIVTL